MSGKSNNILQAARFHKHCRAATDEIFGSLEVAETGNYWFNNQYNLFVTKETEKDREQYFMLKLEKYNGEDCVDFEFDTEDTSSNSEAQLLFAIGNIIERNSFLLDESPYKIGDESTHSINELVDKAKKAGVELTFIDNPMPNKESSLWYGGKVADIAYKGFVFHLEAIGEIRASLNLVDKAGFPILELANVVDKNSGGEFANEMCKYIPSDKLLFELYGETATPLPLSQKSKKALCIPSSEIAYGKLDLHMLNWWEITVTLPDGRYINDIDWVSEYGLYSEALYQFLEEPDKAISYVKDFLEEEKQNER